jgi:hypothetical protein
MANRCEMIEQLDRTGCKCLVPLTHPVKGHKGEADGVANCKMMNRAPAACGQISRQYRLSSPSLSLSLCSTAIAVNR